MNYTIGSWIKRLRRVISEAVSPDLKRDLVSIVNELSKFDPESNLRVLSNPRSEALEQQVREVIACTYTYTLEQLTEPCGKYRGDRAFIREQFLDNLANDLYWARRDNKDDLLWYLMSRTREDRELEIASNFGSVFSG